MSLKPPSAEAFSCGQRMTAVKAMLDRAQRLRRVANKWKALANALIEIETHATSQSFDGSEAGPHIGAGSDAEELLWELASRPIDIGL